MALLLSGVPSTPSLRGILLALLKLLLSAVARRKGELSAAGLASGAVTPGVVVHHHHNLQQEVSFGEGNGDS